MGADVGPDGEEHTLAFVVTRAVLVGLAEVADDDGAVDGAHDLPEGDLRRIPSQHVAAAHTALGAHEAGALQGEQDLFQVRLGKAGALGDVADRCRSALPEMEGEREKSAARVVAARRHLHGSNGRATGPARGRTAGTSQVRRYRLAVTAEALRVIVVDDEPDVRLMLRLQLDQYDGIEVVGEASDGAQALDRCAELNPDSVVMDLLMPKMSGIEAIHVMQDRFASVGVVAYTATAGPTVRDEMARLGVTLLLKSGDVDALVQALLQSKPGSSRLA